MTGLRPVMSDCRRWQKQRWPRICSVRPEAKGFRVLYRANLSGSSHGIRFKTSGRFIAMMSARNTLSYGFAFRPICFPSSLPSAIPGGLACFKELPCTFAESSRSKDGFPKRCIPCLRRMRMGSIRRMSNHPSQRHSYGLNRTWRSTLKIQFQFGRVLFALAGRRLTGNV